MVEITGGFNEEDDDCTNLTEDDFVITTASGNKILPISIGALI